MPAPRAHAPFNFVPADDSLGWPINTDDGSGPERYSGSMRIQINALEPLLVCGPQAPNETRRFFKRDGKYTIPGTSLKGMIRNMLEAQSMSTLAPISPRRPFFRDLNNPTYLGRFVEQNGGGGGRALGHPRSFIQKLRNIKKGRQIDIDQLRAHRL